MPTKTHTSTPQPIKVTVYRWAGQWGPFKVKIPCGECALTKDVIEDVLNTDLAGIPVELDMRDWLSEWWKPIMKGGWHAPIVMVEDKIISQGEALNRGVLAQEIIKHHVTRSPLQGNVLFGKDSCPHCVRAKHYLANAGIEYTYLDVVKNPRALYEMIPRVKAHIGQKTPVTVPQIWLDGSYIGGADQLADYLGVTRDTPAPQPATTHLGPVSNPVLA